MNKTTRYQILAAATCLLTAIFTTDITSADGKEPGKERKQLREKQPKGSDRKQRRKPRQKQEANATEPKKANDQATAKAKGKASKKLENPETKSGARGEKNTP